MTYRWQDHQVHWDKELVSRALIECDAVYRNELSELAYDLNRYHGVSWSSAQYEKLIGLWLQDFIHLLYDRWNSPVVGKPSQFPWDARDPVDLLDHSSYHCSDSLNESLYWQLATLRDKRYLSNLPLPRRLSFSDSFDVRGGGRAPVHIFHTIHSPDISAWRRYVGSANFSRKLGFSASPIELRPLQATTHQVATDWRLSQTTRSVSNFTEACAVLTRLHIPALFLEGFMPMRSAASNHQANYLFATNGFYAPFTYLAAEWHDRAVLLSHQHGGGYGMDRLNTVETHERAVSDIFYSWGWSEGAAVRPLPAPPRVRAKPPEQRSGVLLKCGNFPRYVHRISYQPMATANQTLIEQTIQFAKALTEHGLEISFYHHDYGWRVREQFNDAGLTVREKSRDDGSYALHTCNYLGTAWLETLAANIPTICFYNPSTYDFRETALPFVEELKSVGVLHESADSASDMVLGILDNPQKWWQSDEVQEARLSFVRKYARLEDGWLNAWKEEFTQISNLGLEQS